MAESWALSMRFCNWYLHRFGEGFPTDTDGNLFSCSRFSAQLWGIFFGSCPEIFGFSFFRVYRRDGRWNISWRLKNRDVTAKSVPKEWLLLAFLVGVVRGPAIGGIASQWDWSGSGGFLGMHPFSVPQP